MEYKKIKIKTEIIKLIQHNLYLFLFLYLRVMTFKNVEPVNYICIEDLCITTFIIVSFQ